MVDSLQGVREDLARNEGREVGRSRELQELIPCGVYSKNDGKPLECLRQGMK